MGASDATTMGRDGSIDLDALQARLADTLLRPLEETLRVELCDAIALANADDTCRCLVLTQAPKLMQYALEYKWDTNVWPRLRWTILIEVLSLILCASAVAASSRTRRPPKLAGGSPSPSPGHAPG